MDNRRNTRRLCQFYKIYNNLTPVYLKTPIPAPKQYSNLRTNKPLNVMKCRTCKFSNSFYPDSVSVWNDTSDTIRNITSVTKFKSTLFNIIRPKPRPIFGIHDPKNIRILLQLRVGLSPLKHHKKCHKFQDTPSEICDCGLEAEDTIHFFTKCIFLPTSGHLLIKRLQIFSQIFFLLHHLNSLPFSSMVVVSCQTLKINIF